MWTKSGLWANYGQMICPQIIGGHKVVCVQIVSEQAWTKCGHMRGQIMDKSIIRAWTNSGQIQIMDKLWTKSGLWANCGQTPYIALTNDYFVHNLSTPTSYLSRICPHLHGQIVDKRFFVHNLHIILTVVLVRYPSLDKSRQAKRSTLRRVMGDKSSYDLARIAEWRTCK